MQVARLFHTIKHLKWVQIRYQLWYRLKSKFRSNYKEVMIPDSAHDLRLDHLLLTKNSFSTNEFTFLNKSKFFEDHIDWNYNENGKLWLYNLNYFDFLNQQTLSYSEGISLMLNYVEKYDLLVDGLEPYPTSLRIINWVKFIVRHHIQDEQINKIIIKDTYRLQRNLEYHLLANHLLENIFALVFSSYFLKDSALQKNAETLLREQLVEQILLDGGHYERSPMYHQLMLFRVLDLISLLKTNALPTSGFLNFLKNQAAKMHSWLNNMTLSNNDIPLFNDSCFNINPTTKQLNQFFEAIDIKKRHLPLSDSGYRVLKNEQFESIVNVGNISPSYQPGHAHADSLSFVLYAGEKPIIVDRGISTYEKNSIRLEERSTISHNTVTYRNVNTSDVWSGFRVGRRAQVKILREDFNNFEASHNGYSSFDILHRRQWSLEGHDFSITDTLDGDSKNHFVCRFHIHPEVVIKEVSTNSLLLNNIRLSFSTGTFKISNTSYSPEFNNVLDAKCVEVEFKENLTSKFEFLN